MTQKELKRIFSKGECLSLDALRLYNEGKLSKKSMHEIEMHLLECNLCSGAVDGLNTKRVSEVNKLADHIQRRLAVYMNTPPRVPFFQRFGLVLIAGVIFLAVGGTCVYLAIGNKKEKPVLSDTSATKNPKDVSSSLELENNPLLISTQPDANVPSHVDVRKNENDKTAAAVSKDVITEPEATVQPAGFTVTHETTINAAAKTAEITPEPAATTRSENSLLRVKTVQVYPAVTHNDKASRKEAKDGQLGKPSGNSSSFELDEMPSYPGGNEALRYYIMTNFKASGAEKNKLTKYATGVRFVVDSKTGNVSAPEISVSISPEIDKEILRVINSLPNYTPGKKRGEVEVVIGITFE